MLISSPAGSGKTEKLARRYIALLQAGVDVERVLAITFTDKASAEMKQRILRILKEEDDALFRAILDRMPLMRVTTIHSFCGTLLRRFAFEASIDPNYMIEDAIDSGIVWEEILYEIMMDAGRGDKGHGLLLQTIGEQGFRGLAYLREIADYLYHKSPFSLEAEPFSYVPSADSALIAELEGWEEVKNALPGYEEIFRDGSGRTLALFEDWFLTKNRSPRKKAVPALKHVSGYGDWAYKMYLYWKDKKLAEFMDRTERIREIFAKCIEKYSGKKRARGVLDFSDLEYLTYKMLTENPEWANILYAFDEKTDHLLVDEFQDTNNFQWAIIDKMTEEWRSGQGAKRGEGVRPTIFLVGDEKQSIYFFRGANVEIFRRAGKKLGQWLGEEFCLEEVKENYRSLPVIVEFTNAVFSKIMEGGDDSFPWVTKYTEFEPRRSGFPSNGHIEIVLMEKQDDMVTAEMKEKEAGLIARRIRGLPGDFHVTDKSTRQQRQCRYADMAILLRKRTHLGKYEDALRNAGVPFVSVKGTGFYQEPEIAMLRAFIFFLSNPDDDYSLYSLLKGPFFRMDDDALLRLTAGRGENLFEKLVHMSSEEGADGPCGSPHRLLEQWLRKLPYTMLSMMIENALVATGAWKYFHGAQKRANIKKFIRTIEGLEANGKSIMKIRDFLERTYSRNDEPKANVNTEGMDAVKIMTIHAAKGLEFPIVFVPGMEEPFSSKRDDRLVYEKDGRFFFKAVPEAVIRSEDPDFLMHEAREEEEQKRLFYVAVTRAGEALFLTGHWPGKEKSFLDLLKRSIGIEKEGSVFTTETDLNGVSVLSAEDAEMLCQNAPDTAQAEKRPQAVEAMPVEIDKQVPWKAVTEQADSRGHDREAAMLGELMHAILEAVSKEDITDAGIPEKAERLLEAEGIFGAEHKEKIDIINNTIEALRSKGIWQDIVLPREGSFTELPFVLEDKGTVYSGRIDRVIREGDAYRVYDYKTFPVSQDDMPGVAAEYAFQLNIYKKAVMQLFNAKDVRAYIIFTHNGEVREIN